MLWVLFLWGGYAYPMSNPLEPEDRWFSVRLLLRLATCFSFLKRLRTRHCHSATVAFQGSPKTKKCDKWLPSKTYRWNGWHKHKVLLLILKGIRIAPRDPLAHQRLSPPSLACNLIFLSDIFRFIWRQYFYVLMH